MDHKITFLKDSFQNEKTGENVEGVTIIIDGVFKQVLDKIIDESHGKYNDYTSVLYDALINGINMLIKNDF